MFIPKAVRYMLVLRAEAFPSNQIICSIAIHKLDERDRQTERAMLSLKLKMFF